MPLSHTLRSVTVGMPHLFLGGVPPVRAGEPLLAYRLLESGAVLKPLGIESGAFADGAPIPGRYVADGDNVSPPLTWVEAPAGTQSLALVVEDPDAPTPRPFVHWLVYNLEPELAGIPEGFKGGLQGRNSMFKLGYGGPVPPKGDIPHHYHFQLFALDQMLRLKPGAGRRALFDAMEGHVIGQGELVGTYERPRLRQVQRPAEPFEST